jgi:hypothetical protein
VGLRSWRFRRTKLSASTALDTKNTCSIKHFTANFLNPLLADALLSARRCIVSRLHTLCPRRFTLDSQQLVFVVNPCVGKNKFVKKGRVDFWGGEKNTLLKALVATLPLAAFKSVFFLCVGIFIL